MSFSVSSGPDSTESTVSRTGVGNTRSTPPSGPRTDIDRSGVSNVPGVKSVTSIPLPRRLRAVWVCVRLSRGLRYDLERSPPWDQAGNDHSMLRRVSHPQISTSRCRPQLGYRGRR